MNAAAAANALVMVELMLVLAVAIGIAMRLRDALPRLRAAPIPVRTARRGPIRRPE